MGWVGGRARVWGEKGKETMFLACMCVLCFVCAGRHLHSCVLRCVERTSVLAYAVEQ